MGMLVSEEADWTDFYVSLTVDLWSGKFLYVYNW